MLHVDLSTLGGPELRQLLDTTRKRGQAALSYQILQEMAARREGGGRPRGEPRVISVDLGDPLEAREEAYEEVGSLQTLAPPAEPADRGADLGDDLGAGLGIELGGRGRRRAKPRGRKARREDRLDEPYREPLSLTGWDPSAEETPDETPPGAPLRLEREPPPVRPPPPRRRALWLTAGFAAGMAAEAALAWWLGVPALQPHRAPSAAAAAPAAAPAANQIAAAAIPPAVALPPVAPPGDLAAPAADAALTPTPTPASATAPEPAAPAPPAAAAPASAPVRVAAARPAAQAPAQPTGEALEAPLETPAPGAAEPAAEPVHIAVAGPKGCAGQPKPADRVICADPKLQRLQHELRQAYARALAAHEDKSLLRERQLAWADERDAVVEPAKLARLYEARIRKLEAATEAAKRAR